MTPIKPPGTLCEAPPEYRVLDSFDDWYLLIDEDHDVIWANSALRRIFGVPEGELRQAVRALGGDGDLVARILAALGDGGEIPEFECRIRDLEGEERRCLCSGRKAPSGEGWLLRFRDVPDAGDYEKIVEYTGTATILIEDDGIISVANTEFERLSGYRRHELVGVKRLTDFVPRTDELRRIIGYHALRRSDPAAAPKNYTFSFADRSGNVHTVEVTIGMVPGTNRSVMSLLDVTGRRRAEQALQKSEERLILALSAANDGLVDWDVGTGTIFYSPRCFTMLGHEPGAFVPTVSSLLSLVHPEDRDRVEEALTAMATGERDRFEMEFRARSASGKWIYVLDRLQVVSRDTDGTPLRIAGTHSDITERKSAERELLIRDMAMESALRESEERYRTLAEAAPDIIFLVGTKGDVFYVNSAGSRLLGVEPESLRKKNLRDLFPPAIAERWLAMLRKAAESAGEFFTEETLLPGDDGGTWLETRLIPMTGRDGTVRSLLGISRDVTDRKRDEGRLRFQALVLDQVEDAVTALDTGQRITYMNRAAERLFDVPLSEAVGRPESELFPCEWLHTDDEERVKRVLQSSGTWRGVLLHRKKDGETMFIDATISALTGEDGRSAGTLCSLRDVTAQKRAELELRIKDMAIASSLDAITLADLDGRIIYVNRASLAVHGWEREEEAVGKPASMFLADPEKAKWVGEEVLRNGSWSGEMEARRRDGTTFPMQLALSVVTDESGRPLCVMGSGIDITKRKQAEQELRIRDMAMASSLSAFTIASLDGRLTYVNQAFLSMWGCTSATEVLGRSVMEFWQDREEAANALQTLRDTGRYINERIGRRRDGTEFYVRFSGNLVRSDVGVPICLTASLADITDLKRAEAEVQAHNRELSALNQIIGVSMSATDINETLEEVLAATLALLDLQGGGIYLIEPERRSARLVCVQDLPEGFSPEPCIPDITVPPYAEVLVAGEPLFFDDHPHLRYPGEESETPHPYASIPIVAHEKVIGALNVICGERNRFTDADRSLLTAIGRAVGSSIERTLLIRQLETAEREANLYLDILSHDIRNAENISSLYADILIDMLEGDAKDYAQKIRSSIRKSIGILRNVSTIRRIHHESATLAPVDLDRVIRDELRIFSGSRIHYSGTDLAVMADPLLPEVFTNLIGNAVKFGGPAVEVAIRVEESGGDVRVSIEDTGPGIPDGMKETIFTRFGKNRNRKSGQGLGLSITRMLVERYGGRVRVDDRVPGHPECGAAFRLTLKKA